VEKEKFNRKEFMARYNDFNARLVNSIYESAEKNGLLQLLRDMSYPELREVKVCGGGRICGRHALLSKFGAYILFERSASAIQNNLILLKGKIWLRGPDLN
jgi:hypothetical protein